MVVPIESSAKVAGNRFFGSDAEYD